MKIYTSETCGELIRRGIDEDEKAAETVRAILARVRG